MNINSSNDLIQTLLLLLCTWRHMYQKKMANAESWMHKKLFEIYQCRYKCHIYSKCNIYPVLRYRKFILKCLSFIPISFIVFQDNTNTQNGNKNSWRWDETRAVLFFLQWKMVFLLCLSLFLWNLLAAVNLLTFLPEISLINIDACTCADGTTIIYLW